MPQKKNIKKLMLADMRSTNSNQERVVSKAFAKNRKKDRLMASYPRVVKLTKEEEKMYKNVW